MPPTPGTLPPPISKPNSLPAPSCTARLPPSAHHAAHTTPSHVPHAQVYAIDLLGFGASGKPELPDGYSMELWRDQILAFIEEFMDQPPVLVGNSIGSLACIMVGGAGGVVCRDAMMP